MRITHRDAFTVVGFSARTTNAREMSGSGSIPQLWARLMQGGLLSSVPDHVGSDVVAVYTDYESDRDGPYTFVLGAAAAASEKAPDGMVSASVPEGHYAVFEAQNSRAEQAVVQLWQEIWRLEISGQLARAYQADYEVHRFGSAGESAVAIYVGVKN